MTERELQNHVVDLARTCGYLVFHARPAWVRSGKMLTATQGDVGYPDLTIAGHGRLLFRELKVGYGKLTRAQFAWGEALTVAGADWAVWKETDWPEVIQAELQPQRVTA